MKKSNSESQKSKWSGIIRALRFEAKKEFEMMKEQKKKIESKKKNEWSGVIKAIIYESKKQRLLSKPPVLRINSRKDEIEKAENWLANYYKEQNEKKNKI